MTERPTSIGIGYAIRRDAEARIEKPWRATANYPYNIGHTCLRYLVLCRLKGDQRASHGADTQLLFDMGREIVEPEVVRRLEKIRYEVYRKQSKLPARMQELYNIRGKVDVELLVPPTIQHDLGLPEGLVPGEIKGMGPGNYNYLAHSEDIVSAMLNAPASQWYMRAYPAQLLLYMYGLDKPYGVFIIYNKTNGQIIDRIVWYEDHEDYLESILKRCEQIEDLVDRAELPPPISEWQVCERCDARVICMPENTDEERVAMVSGMEPLLERRDELLAVKRPVEGELKSLNTEIARRLDALPDGTETALAGVWRAKRKQGGGWTYARMDGEAME